MERKNRFLLSVVLFFVSAFFASAQYSSGVITMKNGEKIECQVNNNSLYGEKVLYKLNAKAKAIKVPAKDVYTVVFPDEEGNVAVFENVTNVNWKDYMKGNFKKTESSLINLIEYGDVSLYRRSVQNYTDGVLTSTTHSYVCRKKDTDIAVFIGTVRNGRVIGTKFRTTAKGGLDEVYMKLFGDCKDLCNMISSKKLTLENIEEIVHEYNVYKAESSKKSE